MDNKFNFRIISVLIITILFMQLNTYYYIQGEISKLSDELKKENIQLSEQFNERINKHDEQLTICYGMIFDSGQKIKDIENTIININQQIYETHEAIKKYNKLNINNFSNDINNNNIYEDWQDIYYGRLHIPNGNINVALYKGRSQNITDRFDSANIFTWRYNDRYTIADHNTQEFSKLFKVEIGTQGYIELENGNIVNIKCVDIFQGNNTGTGIFDSSGVTAMDRTDYMMYTCIDSWKNVRIYLWEIIK